jgi:hypothetical protein
MEGGPNRAARTDGQFKHFKELLPSVTKAVWVGDFTAAGLPYADDPNLLWGEVRDEWVRGVTPAEHEWQNVRYVEYRDAAMADNLINSFCSFPNANAIGLTRISADHLQQTMIRVQNCTQLRVPPPAVMLSAANYDQAMEGGIVLFPYLTEGYVETRVVLSDTSFRFKVS